MNNVIIRLAKPSDEAAIIAVTEDAFGQPDEANIVRLLEENGESLLSLVATSEESIVAHFQAFPIEVRGAHGGPVCGIGPISVATDKQKMGIGSRLITEGLQRLKAMEQTIVFVLGDPAYYGRFGFSVAATAGYSAPFGGPAFQALELSSGAPAFGELVYPMAFSE